MYCVDRQENLPQLVVLEGVDTGTEKVMEEPSEANVPVTGTFPK